MEIVWRACGDSVDINLPARRGRRLGFIWSARFAERLEGLAFGLALAVRPAGSAGLTAAPRHAGPHPVSWGR